MHCFLCRDSCCIACPTASWQRLCWLWHISQLICNNTFKHTLSTLITFCKIFAKDNWYAEHAHIIFLEKLLKVSSRAKMTFAIDFRFRFWLLVMTLSWDYGKSSQEVFLRWVGPPPFFFSSFISLCMFGASLSFLVPFCFVIPFPKWSKRTQAFYESHTNLWFQIRHNVEQSKTDSEHNRVMSTTIT